MKLTLKNILVWAAALLGIVAFVLMFTDAIKVAVGNQTENIAGLEVLFGKKTDNGDVITKGAVIAFVGYLLVLLGSLVPTVLGFVLKNKKVAKLAVLCCAVLVLVGAIFVFTEKGSYMSVNELTNGSILGITYSYTVLAGPVIAGILGVLSALLLAASELLEKLLKK